MRISGNTILITGGSRGIGLEMAKQLKGRGNTIIVTGRDNKALESARGAVPGIVTIQSDVAEPGAIDALYQKVAKDFPGLNILINNAGIMLSINLQGHQLSADALTREIDINLKGPIRMIDRFLALLKANENAAIVNVSSGLAFVPMPISPVYCATKAALHSYTQSLRMQLKNTKVKVFELAPPATATELLDSFKKEDMEGASIMKTEAMVAVAIRGLEKDIFEIVPGQASQLRFMSRLAPGFILKQLSKPVDSMHGAG